MRRPAAHLQGEQRSAGTSNAHGRSQPRTVQCPSLLCWRGSYARPGGSSSAVGTSTVGREATPGRTGAGRLPKALAGPTAWARWERRHSVESPPWKSPATGPTSCWGCPRAAPHGPRLNTARGWARLQTEGPSEHPLEVDSPPSKPRGLRSASNRGQGGTPITTNTTNT